MGTPSPPCTVLCKSHCWYCGATLNDIASFCYWNTVFPDIGHWTAVLALSIRINDHEPCALLLLEAMGSDIAGCCDIKGRWVWTCHQCSFANGTVHHLFSFHPLSYRTPLHAAAFAGHVNCVQLLLSHDAPVDIADKSGRTALMMAAQKGRAGALGTEFFHRCFCSENKWFWFLYIICILSCATEVLLTSASANLSLTDKDGNTALHLACSNVCVK